VLFWGGVGVSGDGLVCGFGGRRVWWVFGMGNGLKGQCWKSWREEFKGTLDGSFFFLVDHRLPLKQAELLLAVVVVMS
jgi:hypothetical protein